MQLSLSYKTEVLQRPEGIRDWVGNLIIVTMSATSNMTTPQSEFCVKAYKELGYDWENGEEKVRLHYNCCRRY